MLKDKRLILHICIIILVLIAFILSVRASKSATSDYHTYLPLVQQPGISLETIATVEMPFDVYNAVQPQAVNAVSGWWYITVYRTGASDRSGSWLVRWREGLDAASAIDQPLNAPNDAVEPIPGGPYTNARGTIVCGRDHQIYQFAWHGDGSSPKLVIGRLHGDTC